MERGTLVTERSVNTLDDEQTGRQTRDRDAVTHDRFNVHASVTMAAEDDLGRERLCRYITRPPFALDRLHMRPDGIRCCVSTEHSLRATPGARHPCWSQ